uniref:Conjugal transfer protein, TraB n=2 Tax=Leptospirillum TaxID=179 RepID=B6ASB1_9BACT|nr:MAG: Conjugal transfer protein, TraB [Leptospirillum sp. Group II '5-way CG']EES53693.1 MAG: probable conjugal transfer protein (TraD) [Leptospirillum ferrodiazotrophum]
MRNDNTQIQKPPADLPGLLLAGAVMFVLVSLGSWIAWMKLTRGITPGLSVPLWIEVTVYLLPPGHVVSLGPAKSLAEMDPGLAHSLLTTWKVLSAVSFVLVGIAAMRLAKGPQPVRHKRGDQLRSDAGTIRKQIRARYGVTDGIFVHPGIRIPETLEVRSFSLVGSPGSGKTTVLNGMVDHAIARGDRALIFDFKGDFTERIPNGKKIILSPWDARAVRLALGSDVSSEVQARLLSECLIPINPRDTQPMWGNASRAILRAELHRLMAERQGAWGFHELGDALLADILCPYSDQVVQNLVKRYNPEASRIVQDLTSKTTLSVLIDQSAALGDTILLSRFDLELKKGGRPFLSLRSYLSGETREKRNPLPVILPVHPDSKTLTSAFVSAVFTLSSSIVTNFPDAKPNARRIWFFLDEVPQAGRIPPITDFLVTARSKGCRTVLGFQTPAQVAETYGEKTLEIWDNATSVKVFLQCVSPEAKKYVSQSIGEREILAFKKSDNIGIAPTHTGHTTNWVDEREKLVSPDEAASLLGPGKNGVTGIVQIAGCDPALLTWPFRNYPKAAEARQLVALPLRGTLAPDSPEGEESERERIPENEVYQPETRQNTKEPGQMKGPEPASVRITPLSKPPEASGEKDGGEESPVGEIAGEALEHMAGLDPTVTVLKILAELTAHAPPAAGIRAEGQTAAKKMEQEEEDEENR